ncbi:MAG: FGGY family carbohydrate kinase [Bauldia sp.]
MADTRGDRSRNDGPVLAIEQSSTYTKAVIFSRDRRVLAVATDDLPLLHPAPGWEVQDPEEIWTSVLASCRMALLRANLQPGALSAIAIAAERSAVILWDRGTGQALCPAITANDRRTAARCRALRDAGIGKLVRDRTGLPLTHAFSATKLSWMLDNVSGARDLAVEGRVAFGTVDTFLLWRLTQGRMHATDATQASQTLLFDIRRQRWDDDLLRVFEVPPSILPRVHDSASYFGAADVSVLGGKGTVPVRGMIGIEQASLVGQACFAPGAANVVYDRGCNALLNVGQAMVGAAEGLVTTVGFRLDVGTTYFLEGRSESIADGPRWFSEGLGGTREVRAAEDLARQSDPVANVYWVPASLGDAPLYRVGPGRGTIVGIDTHTGHREFARAVLESVAYQTRDIFQAMAPRWAAGSAANPVRVMGEASLSDWTMQFLADILGQPVERGAIADPAAYGAAWLAASGAGLWPATEGFAREWAVERRFEPSIDGDRREAKYEGWRDALRRSLGASS